MSTDSTKKKPGRKKGGQDLAVRKPRVAFDINVMNKLLKRLEKTGNLADASAFVGVSRDNVYKHMKKDERFRDRVELAKDRCLANYERELDNRIYEGNQKVEYDGDGKVMKKTVTHDNTLLLKALEANDPDKWGKKSSQSEGGTVVNIGDSAISKLATFLKVDLPSQEKDVTPAQDSISNGEED